MSRLPWALAFAAALTFQRLVLGASLGVSFSFLLGLGISALTLAAIGAALSVLVGASSLLLKSIGWVSTVLVVVAHVVVTHYESVFGRFPTASVLYYVTDAKQLAPSIEANAPLLYVALEIVGLIVVLALACRWKSPLIAPSKDDAVLGAVTAVGIVAAIVPYVAPSSIPDDLEWSSRAPAVWVGSELAQLTASPPQAGEVTRDSVERYQRILGHLAPFGGKLPDFPLCSEDAKAAHTTSSSISRSVIFLLLESVGDREMFLEVDGRPVMPNLRAIAKRSLYFPNFFASGTKSNQSLPALYSGVQPQTQKNILWRLPPLFFDGLPSDLARHGVRSIYMHGADLSFESKRQYLSQIGFSELFEYDHKAPMLGWGYDDESMFQRLERWVEQQRNDHTTYFATLATLSTHDPYVLPDSWPSQFVKVRPTMKSDSDWASTIQGVDKRLAFVETLHFLDAKLADFHAWYLREEAPRGTLLIITGDHTPHLIDRREPHRRFRVPLVIDGLDPRELEQFRPYESRVGSMPDVPATVTDLVGARRSSCAQGVSLVSPPERWAQDRIVYAVEGDDLNRMYAWTQGAAVAIDRGRKTLRPNELEPILPADPAALPQLAKRASELDDILKSLDPFLFEKNAYFPQDKSRAIPQRAPITGSKKPLVISHRGNVGDPKIPENSVAAVQNAHALGFPWVEIDLQLLSSGEVVVTHDTTQMIDGRPKPLLLMTYSELNALRPEAPLLDRLLAEAPKELNFALEVKNQGFVGATFAMIPRVAKAARDLKAAGRGVIVDSFDRLTIESIERHCDCETGFDVPQNAPVEDALLDYVASMNLDWVYVEHTQLNPDLVQRAHARGLRVMTYTVNRPEDLERVRQAAPDGLMTDELSIKTAVEAWP